MNQLSTNSIVKFLRLNGIQSQEKSVINTFQSLADTYIDDVTRKTLFATKTNNEKTLQEKHVKIIISSLHNEELITELKENPKIYFAKERFLRIIKNKVNIHSKDNSVRYSPNATLLLQLYIEYLLKIKITKISSNIKSDERIKAMSSDF